MYFLYCAPWRELTNHTWNPPKNRKENVDEEVGTTTSLEENGKRWNEDRKEVEADVGLVLQRNQRKVERKGEKSWGCLLTVEEACPCAILYARIVSFLLVDCLLEEGWVNIGTTLDNAPTLFEGWNVLKVKICSWAQPTRRKQYDVGADALKPWFLGDLSYLIRGSFPTNSPIRNREKQKQYLIKTKWTTYSSGPLALRVPMSLK